MTKQRVRKDEQARVSGHKKFGSMLLLAGLSASGLAFGQSSLPDAQVEANVLKALAGSTELASQPIQTHTVYGTVTLSGSVSNESQRRQAETLASTSVGVKKVVDELTLGEASASAAQPLQTMPDQTQADKLVLQSDGTYAPAQRDSATQGSVQPQRNNPEADQALDQQMNAQQQAGTQGTPQTGYPGAPEYPRQSPAYPAGQPNGAYPQNPVYGPNQQANGGYPPYSQSAPYPRGSQPNGNYPPPLYRRPYSGQMGSQISGQTGGQTVVIPSGTFLRVRLNQRLSTEFAQAGQSFDGIVTNDIVAGGAVAIPRGASVQGKVIESAKSGVLKGRGELSIQLTQVSLGGTFYPIASDVWSHHGGDKTLESVNKTAIGGGLGALVGAAAGGGVGAAVGAGVGGALGLGSSAASGNGQVYLPAESVVSFRLAQPATVVTVGQDEMQRLAYGVPNGPPTEYPRRRVYRYPVYVGPGYYRPYGYGPYPYPY